MVFLDFHLFKPETWLSGAADGVMGTILGAIRTLLFYITSIIFELMVNVYNLFDKLCNARILDNEIIEIMSQRIGLVLGLVMFFYVVFSFIQMMVDPDKVSDREKGAFQIAKKAVIVVIMLGVSTFFFKVAFGLQKTIIESEVIRNLLIPYNIEGLEEKKFGNLLSVNLMNAFYEINSDIENGDVTIIGTHGSNNFNDCKFYLEAFREQIYSNNKYDLGYICLNSSLDVSRVDKNGNTLNDQIYVITFNSIIAPLVGGFTAYLLLMYCFKVGVRMIQLAFLEIISPMAIVSYLSPKKDNMFTKWWKIYFATYIDVFIRIAIINLVTFLICVVFSADTAGGKLIFWETVDAVNGTEKNFFTVVIVLALLTFAKKAPDLLKELLPASASKLGFGLSMKDIVGLDKFGKWAPKAATGVLGGALGGAAMGLLGGGFGGFAGGLFKGALSGLKGQGFMKTTSSAWKDRAKMNAEFAKLRANGGSWTGYTFAKLQHGLGIRTAFERDEQLITDLEAESALYNTASKEAEGEAIKNASNYIGFSSTAGATLTLRQLEKLSNDQTISSQDRASYQDEYNQLLKSATMFNLDYGLAVEKGQINFDAAGDLVALVDGNGNIYKSYSDIDRIVDKSSVIGEANATIEANISKLAGDAGQGRGKRGKAKRNANNSTVTRIKLSNQYKANKANNSGK